jgi:hypothetical protein
VSSTPDAGTAARHDPARPQAGIVVEHRRADQIVDGDVIILPDLVYLPHRHGADANPRWTWREQRSAQLPGAHAWRWVYDVGALTEDPDGIGACLSLGFVLLRVSDDQPNQGGEHRDLVLCLRGLDLVAVQTHHSPHEVAPVDEDHHTETGSP